MKNNKTLWLTVIEHLQQVGAGNNITRQQLLKNAEGLGFSVERAKVGLSTVDTYRNYLRGAGYLKTVFCGVYEILKVPESGLTIWDAKDNSEGYLNRHGVRNPWPITQYIKDNAKSNQ